MSTKSSPKSSPKLSPKLSPKSSPKAPPKPPSKKPSKEKIGKGVQVQRKPKQGSGPPCPWLCNMVPTNVPGPGPAQTILHPRKDVFVLKVAKVGPTGDRRCKMELELVTPKGPEKKPLYRIDTRETQCDPEPPPCCCMKPNKKRK